MPLGETKRVSSEEKGNNRPARGSKKPHVPPQGSLCWPVGERGGRDAEAIRKRSG